MLKMEKMCKISMVYPNKLWFVCWERKHLINVTISDMANNPNCCTKCPQIDIKSINIDPDWDSYTNTDLLCKYRPDIFNQIYPFKNNF